MASESFWNNREQAQKVIDEANSIRNKIEPLLKAEKQLEDFGVMIELSEGEPETEQIKHRRDLERDLARFFKELEAHAAGAHATGGLESTSDPAPTFFALELHVGNYLWNSGRHDYDVALVEQIAAYIVEHPPYSGTDIDAYWAAFPS